MKTKYLLYALPALMLGACSNEEQVPAMNEADGAAVVRADIAGMMVSRAHDSAWDAGDKVGISGTMGAVAYVNVPYTTQGDGAFAASEGVAKGIFFQNKEEVSFSAYYPYSAAVDADNAEIAANTTDQSESKSFDFLFADGAKGSVDNPAINFIGDAAFSHKMTQLVVKVTPDTDSGFDAETALAKGKNYLIGLKSEGKFNTTTGVAEGEAADWALNENVTPTEDGLSLTYAMILFPQQVADGITYRIEYDGAAYSCTLNPALEAGKRYTYNVTLKKTGLTVASSTITDWSDEEAVDVNGGMEGADPFNGHEAVLMRKATENAPALYVATCNLGASTPYEEGLYFWWGDVVGHVPGDGFLFNTQNQEIITTYKTSGQLEKLGIVGKGNILTPDYDAAQSQWGGAWRMPTNDDMYWLIESENCTWEWDENIEGHSGYWVTSNSTGNKIFLPKTGTIEDVINVDEDEDNEDEIIDEYSSYYTSSISYYQGLNLKMNKSTHYLDAMGSWYGATIRPVLTR